MLALLQYPHQRRSQAVQRIRSGGQQDGTAHAAQHLFHHYRCLQAVEGRSGVASKRAKPPSHLADCCSGHRTRPSLTLLQQGLISQQMSYSKIACTMVGGLKMLCKDGKGNAVHDRSKFRGPANNSCNLRLNRISDRRMETGSLTDVCRQAGLRGRHCL